MIRIRIALESFGLIEWQPMVLRDEDAIAIWMFAYLAGCLSECLPSQQAHAAVEPASERRRLDNV